MSQYIPTDAQLIDLSVQAIMALVYGADPGPLDAKAPGVKAVRLLVRLLIEARAEVEAVRMALTNSMLIPDSSMSVLAGRGHQAVRERLIALGRQSDG